MRNDDLSQSGNQHLTANDDYDVIKAGTGASANGNTITGRGTVSGAAGADDTGTGGAHVTGITGAGGGNAASMEAAGRYGSIKIDAQGNYTYTRHHNSPDNVQDVFTYTLADKSGTLDSARLIIRIEGQEEAKIQDNAQRIVAGNEVITLPAGVELSDIHVVGRDLVIDLPDGTQMVITDGAVFVPQLALGDVELPSDTLASLLIDSEPTPAAGTPQSSGGNFGEPVAPLDPGVPLGDLLPPTELDYTPPEFEETYIPQKPDEPDFPPEIFVQPDGQPASVAATDEVDEAGLNSPPNDHAGSNFASDSEETGGNIVFSSPDGVTSISISINGTSYVIYGPGAVDDIPGDYGTLHINSVNVAGGTASYTYVLDDNVNHLTDTTPWEDFTVSLEDGDGDVATATLRINIADDVPAANPDADSVTEDGPSTADGNVFTGTGGSDVNGTDGVADVQGADGANVTSFRFGATAGVLGGPALDSAHGSLTLNSAGLYVYTLDNTDPAVQALGAGETMTEVFNYSITDGDGDVRETTLTITIVGTNDRPNVVSGETAVTEEAFLAPEDNQGNPDAVGNPSDNASSASVAGDLSISDVDGDAMTVTLSAPAGSFYSHGELITWLPSDGGHTLTGSTSAGPVIVITINDVASGGTTAHYTVNLLEQIDHPVAGTSPATSEDIVDMVVGVHANDGSVTTDGSLTIHVEDDSPIVTGPATFGPGVDLDESNATTNPLSPGGAITVSSLGAIIAAPVSFGGDGGGGDPVYAISLTGAIEGSLNTDLVTSDGNHPITLIEVDPTHINGVFTDGGEKVAFSITINGDGSITVTQNYALEHSDAGSSDISHNDTNSPLTLDGLITAHVVYEDYDHDTVEAHDGIGQLIRFFDDGPSIDVTVDAKPTDPQAIAALALTTQDDGTEGPNSTSDSDSVNLAGLFHSTKDGGADGEASSSLTFTFDLLGDSVGAPGVDSGLQSHDAIIYLYQIDASTIVGSTSATLAGATDPANLVFQLATTSGGTVTLTQYQQIDHDTLDPTPGGTPFADHIVSLGGGLINLVGTGNITDNDNDTDSDSATLDMGGLVRFQDDGPAIDATIKEGASLHIDESVPGTDGAGETDLVGLGQVTVAISTIVNVANTGVSADAPTTIVNSLTLGAAGAGGLVASGLMTSAGDLPIYLYAQLDGSVVGSTSAVADGTGVNGGNTVFTVALSGGNVVMTQYQAIEHTDAPNNYDEDSGHLLGGALNLTVTATDFDGDTATDTVDLGSVVSFGDDGPTIDVTVDAKPTDPAAIAALALTTQDDGTEGPNSTSDSDSVSLAGLFHSAKDGGSDGEASSSLVFTFDLLGDSVGAPGVDSGLQSHDAIIYLYQIDATTIVGSTSATLANAQLPANLVFQLSTTSGGTVTLTQYQQIDHDTLDPTPGGTPFADHIVSLGGGLINLVGTGTITDNDGDKATDAATLDMGGLVRFQDDGPAIDATIKAGAALHIDESLPGTDGAGETDAVGLGQVTVAVSAIVNVADTSVSADAPTTYANALNLGPAGAGGLVDSGLFHSAPGNTDQPIYLFKVGGVVYGTTSTSAPAGVDANTMFTIALVGGNVVMTQYGAIENPTAGDGSLGTHDENSGVLASGALLLTVTATDFDGDTATDSVDLGSIVTFGDDGPVASDRTLPGTQAENANVVVDVTADIDAGSDGFDHVQYLSTSGTGTVDYDIATQVFTYHPGSGESGTVTITYRVFDNDGDWDDATISFDLADSSPVAIDVTAKIDDDGLGGNAASTVGDINANDASEYGPGIGNEAIWTGHLGVSSGGTDTPLTYSLAGMAGPGVVGAENVTYSWNGVSNTLTATTVGGTRPNTILFTVQITDNHSGDYQITLVNPIMHAVQTAPGDETSAPEVQLTYTVSDSDVPADTDTGLIKITFNDDAPTAALALKGGAFLVVDETDGVAANAFETDAPGSNLGVATMTAADLFVNTSVYGADGPAAAGSAVYSLAINGLTATGSSLATTMITSNGNLPITLYLMADGSIVGSTAGSFGTVSGANTVFSVSIAANGTTTLTQFQAVEHTDFPTNYDENTTQGGLPANGIQAVLTVKDADSDLSSSAVDLGSRIQFEDDGPTAAVSVTGVGVVHDETANIQGDANDVAAFAFTVANPGTDPDGSAPLGYARGTGTISSSGTLFGSDSAGSVSIALDVASAGVDSGVTTTDGTKIWLFNESGVIVGRVGTTALLAQSGVAAFAIRLDATNHVEMVQFLSVNNPTGGTSYDEPVYLADNVIKAVVTATDSDGDKNAASAFLAHNSIGFQDDGPTAALALKGGAFLVIDETDGVTANAFETDPVGGGNLGVATMTAADLYVNTSVYGVDGPATSGSAVYSLQVNGSAVAGSSLATTLITAQGNLPITLYLMADGSIVGSTAGSFGTVSGANTVFTVSIAANGTTTMTQYQAIEHSISPSSYDETSTVGALPANGIQVALTVKDGDADTNAAVVDLGSRIQFEDDGPTAALALKAGAFLVIDETDGVTANAFETDPVGGGNLGVATMTAADLFVNTSVYGSDGQAASGSAVYSLAINGLTATGSSLATTLITSNGNLPITLYLQADGSIVGSTAGSFGTVGAANIVFSVSIAANGTTTMTQYQALEHTDFPNNFDENTVQGSIPANGIQVVLTVKDGDNDTNSASVDLGSRIQFEDDGPNAGADPTSHPVLTLDESAAGTDTPGGTTPVGDRSESTDIASYFAAAIYGSDSAGTTGNALVLNGGPVASGLYALDPTDTLLDSDGIGQGAAIMLEQHGTQIWGVAGGQTYFTIDLTGTTLTFTQAANLNIWHPNTGALDEAASISIAANTITIVHTVTDSDGDKDTAVLDLSTGVFSIQDDGPKTIVGTVSGAVGEDALVPDGNPDAGDPKTTSTGAMSLAGLFSYGTDGAGDVRIDATAIAAQLTAQGLTSGSVALKYNVSADGHTLTAYTGASVGIGNVFTLVLSGTNATFTLLDQIDHTGSNLTGSGDDQIKTIDFSGIIRAYDADGDSVGLNADSFKVTVEDDVPAQSAGVVTAHVDEDELPAGITDGDGQNTIATGSLSALASVGADQPGTFTFNLTGATLPTMSSGGASISYAVLGSGTILVGYTGADPNILANRVFTVTLSGSDNSNYSVALLKAIDHTGAGLSGTGDNEVKLVDFSSMITVTDKDNDSTALDSGSFRIEFEDDIPTTFSPQAATTTNNAAGIVLNAALDFGDGAGLTNNYGADGGKAVFTLTGLPSTQTSGGVALFYTLSNGDQTLTATAGNGGPVVYTATITGSTYTLDIVNPIDSLTTVDFLNGAYDHPGGNPDFYGFYKAGNDNSSDLLLTAASGGTTVNLNSNLFGIGAGNSMDPGDAVRLDFITDLTPTGTSNGQWTYDGHYTTNGATVGVAKANSATARFTAYDDPDGNQAVGDGSPDTITQVAIKFGVGSITVVPTTTYTSYVVGGQTFWVVLNADGSVSVGGLQGTATGDVQTTVGVYTATGYNSLVVAYENGSHGNDTFKIGGFGAAVPNTDPVIFDIPVKIIDGDGDETTPSNIHVTLNTPAPPVVLDTNHDGHIGFQGIDAGVLYDMNGDGHLDHTAWVGAGDSILFRDSDGNGTVSDAGEFVFGAGNLTDLAALHAMYGAQLDANDADFTMFALWNDANSNGVVDGGEISTLAEAGITSIALASDGVASSEAGGDVAVSGHGDFTYVNDNGDLANGKLADASFGYRAGTADDEQRLASTATNASLLAIAAAAAGLAEQTAAATPSNDDRATSPTDPSVNVAPSVEPVSVEQNDDLAGSSLIANDDGPSVEAAPAAHHNAVVAEESNIVIDPASHDDAAPQALPQGIDTPAVDMTPLIDVAPLTVAAEAAAPDVGDKGGAHQNAVVVGDIIEQPDAAIEQVLAKFGGGDAGHLAIVESAGKAVQGWDMGDFAHLPANAMEHIGAEASLLHPDAVQPVMHG